MMKSLRIIGIGLLVLLCGQCANRPTPSEKLILSVTSTQVDICTEEYNFTFTDPQSSSGSYVYWVGLRRNNEDPLTWGQTITLTPPFQGHSLVLDLRSTITGSLDNIYGIVVKQNPPGAAGSLANNVEIGQSGPVTVPLIAPNCCNFQIALTSNSSTVGADDHIEISADPAMPLLQATASGSLPVNDAISWRLRVTFNRSGRNDTSFYPSSGPFVTVPSGSFIPSFYWSTDFRGGSALLTCTSQSLGCSQSLEFCIRGENPSQSNVEAYMNANLNQMWYWKYVAMEESDEPSQKEYDNQFNSAITFYYSCVPSDPSGVDGSNGIAGTPNAAGDGGFGIFQLTSPFHHAVNSNEIWSWKVNVDTGTGLLNVLQGLATNDLNAEYAAAALQKGIDYFPPPDYPYYYDLYDGVVWHWNDNIYSDDRAVALKRYNGAGNGDWVAWNADLGVWQFTVLNNPPSPYQPFDYVYKVCGEIFGLNL